MPERCQLQQCVPVRVNCNNCVVDTNCYINYDPFVHNLRKIYRSYEDKAKNVKDLPVGCTPGAQYYVDYKIVFAGFITHGGHPKKSNIKFYDVDAINKLFTQEYVVIDSNNRERIICDDTCPFKICQPHNIPANSKFRLFFVFEYKYDICDTEPSNDKPPKYDLYVADLPNVNCHFQDQCKVPQLNLQLVTTLDTANSELPDTDPAFCYLCTASPNDDCCSKNINYSKNGIEEILSPHQVLSILLAKISL